MRILYLIIAIVFLMSGCSMNYSFTGASIPLQLETASVQYFENRAPVVNPSLSQDMTESMKDMIQSRTRLRLTNDIGDADFSGVITSYRTAPVSIQADERANLERLTITMSVNYANTANPDQNFDASFSRYADYDSRVGLESVEAELVRKIVSEISEDIFNRAFVNW